MELNKKATWPGWETVRLIGRGSFGAVYEIERDVLGEKEKAALKVISIPQSDSDISEMYSDGYDDESITSTFKEHLKSIVAEYSLMRKLNGSANVVNCDDVRYVQHDDGFGWDIFIKMELLTPLTSALTSEVTEEQVIKIAKDLCHALVQCKQFGIIHRDIKPQNIFVSPLGDYKLGDFGIAKTVEKTSGGTKIGTYKYMAPEVYNNQPYGAGADVYSLGLVLYWLLNERRMPFLPLPPEKLRAGLEEQARMRRFRGEAIPAPAHGSEKLKGIVLKACAFDPKDRYQSAEDMLIDLETLGGTSPRAAVGELKNVGGTAQGAFSGGDEATISTVYENAEQGEDKTVGVFHTKTSTTSVQEPIDQEPEEDKTVGAFSHPVKAQEQTKSTDVPQKKKKGLILGVVSAIVALAAILLIVLLTDGSDNIKGGAYDIVVWVTDAAVDLTEKQIEDFNNSNNYGLYFNATIVAVGEGDAADRIIADKQAGGDLYCFPQDQFTRMLQAGVLDPIDASSATKIINSNAYGTVLAATSSNTLYAYPMTADNGYFMYYDKSVIPESDISSLESLIADCESAGRYFAFEVETSAWYMASFFFATGCASEWAVDSSGQFIWVYDTFDSQQGIAAAMAMRSLMKSPIFLNSSSASDFADGAAIVISGIWDYGTAESILGNNLGVAELPCFTADGRSYHLGSYSGSKLMGVKPQENADRRAALHALAQHLTNEQCQKERFRTLGWGPSNINAQNSVEVRDDPALAALLAQSAYAIPQGQIPGNWWGIAADLAKEIKNASEDSAIQAALDQYQASINALVS